jgi:crotonobetainyl-CoA:carnitine CoA-transferase CaiB-like acyl-CoA transferase
MAIAAPDRSVTEADADAVVAGWIGGLTLEHIMERLLAARVPATPVHDIEQLLSDPQITARGSLRRVSHPALGPVAAVSPTPRLGLTPGDIRSLSPAVGEHNREILGRWLGINEAEIEAVLAAAAPRTAQ